LGVAPPLPAYALENPVLKPAAVKQCDKKRQAEGRQGTIEEREVGLGNTRIEAEERAQPEQGENPSCAEPFQGVGPEVRVPKIVSQDWQSKKKKKIERPENGERERVVEKQLEILSPALDHGAGAAIHARRYRVVGVAEAQTHFAPLRQEGQLYIFEDLARHTGMTAEAPVSLALHEKKLAIGSGDALAGG